MSFWGFLGYCFYCMMQVITSSCDSYQECFIGIVGWIVLILLLFLSWKLIKFLVTRHAVKKYLKEREKEKSEIEKRTNPENKEENK